MNIALPALLVFFFLIPGFIFQKFFRKGYFELEYKEPFAASTLNTVFAALIIHSTLITLISLITGQDSLLKPVSLHFIVELFVSGKAFVSEATTIDALANSLPQAVVYLIISCFIGAVLGYFSRMSVLKWFGKQTLIEFFLGSNKWEKTFWLKGKKRAKYLTRVAASIDMAAGTFVYMGFLDDFTLDKNGELDRLELEFVSRRKLENDLAPDQTDPDDPNDPEDRFYEIIGDRFICKYKDIKTLNIEYLEIEESDNHSNSVAPPTSNKA